MSVARLLAPRSIAIVGASDKVGPGFNAWNALKAVGFQGEVHLVNPSRDSLFGQTCYPSIDAVPATLDAVFVAVPFDRVLDVVKQSAAKGAAGLAILSSGFGEAGPEGAKAQSDLVSFAAAHGIAVCGPNCLGFLNFAGRTRVVRHIAAGQSARGQCRSRGAKRVHRHRPSEFRAGPRPEPPDHHRQRGGHDGRGLP